MYLSEVSEAMAPNAIRRVAVRRAGRRSGPTARSRRRSAEWDVAPQRREASHLAGGNRPAADHPVAVIEDSSLPGRERPLRLLEVDARLVTEGRHHGRGQGRVGADLHAGGKGSSRGVAGNVADILQPAAR